MIHMWCDWDNVLSGGFTFLCDTQKGYNSQTPLHIGGTIEAMFRSGLSLSFTVHLSFTHTDTHICSGKQKLLRLLKHNREKLHSNPCLEKGHSGKIFRWEYICWTYSEWNRNAFFDKGRFCKWHISKPTITNTHGYMVG